MRDQIIRKILEIHGDGMGKSIKEVIKNLIGLSDADFKKEAWSIRTAPTTYRGIGTGKVQGLLEIVDLIELHIGNPDQLDRDYFRYKMSLFVNSPDERIDKLFVSKYPVDLIYTMIYYGRKIKESDIYILENFRLMGVLLKSGSKGYEELRREFSDIFEYEMPEGTIRAWINRLRKKIDSIIDECFSEFPEFFRDINKGYSLNAQPVHVIEMEQLSDLFNEEYATDLSPLFIGRLIEKENPSYENISEITMKGMLPRLMFVRKDMIHGKDEFKSWRNWIIKMAERHATTTKVIRRIEIPKAFKPEIQDYVTSQILKFYELDPVFYDDRIEIPSTKAKAPTFADHAVQLLQESGKELSYDYLFDEIPKRFGVEWKTDRQLRDALFVHPRVRLLGRRAQTYILSEWSDEYAFGSIKDLIFTVFEKRKAILFHFDIYQELLKLRENVNYHNVKQALAHADFFTSHSSGFYSLKSQGLNNSVRRVKINPHMHATAKEDKHLNEESLFNLLKSKFPELSDSQLEYLIYITRELE